MMTGVSRKEKGQRGVLQATLISFTDWSPTVEVALLLVLPQAAIK